MKVFILATGFVLNAGRKQSFQTSTAPLRGWLDNFLPPPYDPEKESLAEATRRRDYPEQYPATYELLPYESFESDDIEASTVRPLLKQTQLESRPLKLVYHASQDGWNPESFHRAVDGKGAAIVLARTETGRQIGGYNPKGWASTGGARPSVASFLYYNTEDKCQKLRKVGGGGLACAQDDPSFGISFGPDGLVIGLQPGREKEAQSKLGPYFERGPEDLSSLCGGRCQLEDLKVFVGKYNVGDEIPYSGAVLDMTSG
jgi:hypothetical protein